MPSSNGITKTNYIISTRSSFVWHYTASLVVSNERTVELKSKTEEGREEETSHNSFGDHQHTKKREKKLSVREDKLAKRTRVMTTYWLFSNMRFFCPRHDLSPDFYSPLPSVPQASLLGVPLPKKDESRGDARKFEALVVFLCWRRPFTHRFPVANTH